MADASRETTESARIQIADLRQVAEGVDPSGWHLYERPTLLGVSRLGRRVVHQPMPNGEKPGFRADVEFIATFDPPTVLTLLDRLTAVEALANEWAEYTDDPRAWAAIRILDALGVPTKETTR